MDLIVNLKDVNQSHVKLVGGKNASLGEMLQNLSQSGVDVCGGYALTTEVFHQFIQENKLEDKIKTLLCQMDIKHKKK